MLDVEFGAIIFAVFLSIVVSALTRVGQEPRCVLTLKFNPGLGMERAS